MFDKLMHSLLSSEPNSQAAIYLKVVKLKITLSINAAESKLYKLRHFHSNMLLPAEILDHILVFLQSDVATLKACSKCHPILSQLAERHLYTNVIFQNIAHIDFMNVLRDRPYIATYVRTLEIEFIRDAMDFLEEITFTLPKLTMIRRIRLARTGYPNLSWQRLPETFRLAFLDCLRLPSVTDISTISIAFPLSILSHCKHIRYLSLQWWNDDRTDPVARGDNICPPTLDSLALHDCNPECLGELINWIQPCHLSRLEFSSHQNLDVLSQILIIYSHSLTSLVVDINDKYQSRYHDYTGFNQANHPTKAIPIRLSDLRNLQHLTIHAKLERTNVFSWICEFSTPLFAITQVLKPASSLKRLTLDFKFIFIFDDYQDARRQITDILCIPLHSLLVQSASTIDSVCLRLKSMPIHGSIALSSNTILSIFAGHSDLAQFVENGSLILTPVD